MKGVMRFWELGKHSPCNVGPFEKTKRVGKLAQHVGLESMYEVFHILMLRKYILNLDHVIKYEPREIEEGLSYEEASVQIVGCKE